MAPYSIPAHPFPPDGEQHRATWAAGGPREGAGPRPPSCISAWGLGAETDIGGLAASPEAGLSEGPMGRGLRCGNADVWSASFARMSQMLITCLAHGGLSNICEGIRLSTSVYKPFNLQSLISSPVLTFILETSDTRFTSRPAGGGGARSAGRQKPLPGGPRAPESSARPAPRSSMYTTDDAPF